ncbi:MAG TPA: serine/threonine-protein kinase, partial [Gemmatimonadales bacterium]|nr:serine/threonine-protein kinase [Gemmatimonadales bacterium]
MSDPLAAFQSAVADRYAIEGRLGEGGMAIVFLANDLRHSRAVAVKVLRPEFAAVLGPERFLREINFAAELNHPHIVPLFDSGVVPAGEGHPALPYYVMPRLEGETLRDRIAREGALPIDEAVDIARQVAQALAYAHAQGIIHRDIKPANILLSAGEAVVADFGIARAVDRAGEVDRITDSGLTLGTPAYMAPEQTTGDSQLDGRADIYALGCVLYEMLGGTPPFSGATAAAVIARHRTDTP